MQVRTILVAIDASPRAAKVLGAGVEVARRFDAKIVLLRAVGIPAEFPPEVLSADPARVPDILSEMAKTDLEARARAVPAELLEDKRVVIGVAWDAICRTADETNADLIVIGSHGYSGIDRVIGTTAARVINHANRSVLVVRDSKG